MIANHELSEGILQLVVMMVTLIVMTVMIMEIMKVITTTVLKKLESVRYSL